jgi:chemotaxis protein methyltransferase CheR
MDRTTFESLRTLVYTHSGIFLNDTKEAMVSSRISKRMRLLGIASHAEYLEYLVQDTSKEEIIHFVDVISTNVTSFFREPQHFTFLKESVAQWIGQGRRRYRIWSAASSTGEEPYSIAMTMYELVHNKNIDLKILATDISTKVLAAAQNGCYTEAAIKNISPSFKQQFFTKNCSDTGTLYAVTSTLRSMVVFRRMNLSQLPFPLRGNLDVVFCRNVMIYFDAETRTRLVNEIHRLLRPGGYLFTGHAESLASLRTNFKCLQPSIYQKQ